MKDYKARAAALSLVLVAASAGAGMAANRTEEGAARTINGARVTTWSVMDDNDRVQQVGVTIPLSVIAHPPASPGHGPAGAVAVLPFPARVQQTTYMNHLEMHWNPQGHPPAIFQVPHFDFHFYDEPESDVMSISAMDATPPAAEYLPKGYIYPGKDTFEMQMGVHTLDPAALTQPFTAVMIGGCDKGRMNFIEPMVTQAYLLDRKDFTLDTPVPAKFAHTTMYPMKFQGKYDRKSDTYRLTFSDFRPVQ
jgi:hypothetical protein